MLKRKSASSSVTDECEQLSQHTTETEQQPPSPLSEISCIQSSQTHVDVTLEKKGEPFVVPFLITEHPALQFLRGMRYQREKDYAKAAECFMNSAIEGDETAAADELDLLVGYCRCDDIVARPEGQKVEQSVLHAITVVNIFFESNNNGIDADYSFVEKVPSSSIAEKLFSIVKTEQLMNLNSVINFLHRLADSGVSGAQYYLGVCYKEGYVVEQDDFYAAHFFKLAAKQEHPLGQLALGEFYEQGLGGVLQNQDEAARLYLKSAFQYHFEGDSLEEIESDNIAYQKLVNAKGPTAKYCLGLWYEFALKTRYDRGDLHVKHLMAAMYYKIAALSMNGGAPMRALQNLADMGMTEGQTTLGNCYLSGEVVQQDSTKALALYKKAAAKNDWRRLCELAKFYVQQEVKQNYFKAAQLCRRCLAKLRDIADVTKILGMSIDDLEVIYLLKMLSIYCIPEAKYYLAEYYEDHGGESMEGAVCMGQALELFQQDRQRCEIEAKVGNAAAQCRLGNLYKDGRGVKQDFVKAAQYYEAAARQGDSEAQSNLGNLFRDGKGVLCQSYAEAAKYYTLAAENGDEEAQYNLAVLYKDGKAVPKDYDKALDWFQKAIENGYPISECNLIPDITSLCEIAAKNFSLAKTLFAWLLQQNYDEFFKFCKTQEDLFRIVEHFPEYLNYVFIILCNCRLDARRLISSSWDLIYRAEVDSNPTAEKLLKNILSMADKGICELLFDEKKIFNELLEITDHTSLRDEDKRMIQKIIQISPDHGEVRYGDSADVMAARRKSKEVIKTAIKAMDNGFFYEDTTSCAFFPKELTIEVASYLGNPAVNSEQECHDIAETFSGLQR